MVRVIGNYNSLYNLDYHITLVNKLDNIEKIK